METHCLLCRISREPGVTRCKCGYVYSPPPRPGYYHASDLPPDYEHNGMPVYVPTGWVSLFFILVITGTNGTGMVVMVVGLGAVVCADMFRVVSLAGLVMTFGLTTVAFDLLSRRMLRCSLIDVTRGSQFMKVPVWGIGLVVAVSGAVALN